jgi:hypothetical protein
MLKLDLSGISSGDLAATLKLKFLAVKNLSIFRPEFNQLLSMWTDIPILPQAGKQPWTPTQRLSFLINLTRNSEI